MSEKLIYYKGRGNHSVLQLEQMVEQRQFSLANTQQDLKQARERIKELESLLVQFKDMNSKNYKESCEWEFSFKTQQQEIEVLKAKLEKCKEQRNDYILSEYEPYSHALEVIKDDETELSSITIDSIKRGEG